MPDYFSGRVHTIVFENVAQSFYILKLILDSTDDETGFLAGNSFENVVTIRGNIPGMTIQAGTWVGFEGEWVNHDTFGRQILISNAPMVKEWTSKVAGSLLRSNGVGHGIMALIENYFEDDLVTVLDKYNPSDLMAVAGITDTLADHVISRWRNVKIYYHTLEFLSAAGIPRQKIATVWQVFGDRAEEVLTTNPWALVQIDGISFTQADEVAKRLDLPLDAPVRLQGAIQFIMKTRKGLGHLYLTSSDLINEVESLLGQIAVSDVGAAISALHKTGLVVVDKKTRAGVVAIYEPWLYEVEEESAHMLLARMKTARIDRDSVLLTTYATALGVVGPRSAALAPNTASAVELGALADAALMDWASGSQVELSEKQLAGARNALTEPVCLITGLPGTGKSTSLKAVVSILKDAGVSFLLLAPTGIAAKRITSLTGAPASTVHRAFGAKGWDTGVEREATYAGVTGQSSSNSEGSDGSTEAWGYSEANPYPADVVVIDECFHWKQPILTEYGWRPIGQVVEQQMAWRVWSRHPETGELELKPIVRWLKNPNPCDLLSITVEGGHGVMRCTPTHKIYTPTGKVAASTLKVGDVVLVRNADQTTGPAKVLQINPFRDDQFSSVYDIEVADHHNYIAGNVVVSNCSMVDQHLIYRILTCTRPTTRLIFIGDAAQLPSVGAGNVLRDLIASSVFPTVALTDIFRQKDTSQIVVAAHAINRGDMPEFNQGTKREFILIPAETEEQVLDIVIRLAQKLYEKKSIFQVMSPKHGGVVGVTNLNSRLRELLNPKQPGIQEMRLGTEIIREDDRVMVVKNNYKKGVFNGDVGKVTKLDRKLKEVTLKVHGPPISYTQIPFKDAASFMRLAYCVTVHKMQGSESDIIILPLVMGFNQQLQRNLIYTAVTRARKQVILVGQAEAMLVAVKNNNPDGRNTLFLDRILQAAKTQ